MTRVPPSEQTRQEWNQLLCSGTSGEENLLEALVRTGARYMLQMAIEQEVTEFLDEAISSAVTVTAKVTGIRPTVSKRMM
ncbi:MAG: hypothetical protein GXX09_11935 [Syntrophomonadaceae bacterium]|nr:hypothetical protein [Syntrophomonadaceae bacterium]